MNFKHLLLLFVAVTTTNFLFSQNVTIDVTLENNTFTDAALKLAYGNNTPDIVTAKIQNNHFVLRPNITADDLYAISFGDNKAFLLCLHPNDNIKITLDASNLQRVPSVSGSKSVIFSKEITDLMASRQTKIDSLNKELKLNHTQLVFSSFMQKFSTFAKAHQDADEDVLAAIEKNDSLVSLFKIYAPKGTVGKKDADVFLHAAINNFKVLNNYYATFRNYSQNIAQTYTFGQMEHIGGYDNFYLNLQAYTQNLNDHDALIESLFNNYCDKINDIITEYDNIYFDGGLDNPKTKMAFCNRMANLIGEYGVAITDKATALKNDASILKSLATTVHGQAQSNVETIVNRFQQEFNNYDKQVSERARDLIVENKSDLATMMFLDYFSADKSLQTEVIDALHEAYPQHPLISERYEKMNKPQNRTAEGNIAPELEFPDPNGNMRKLSDLRGKVVLVDFWASWCGPCRRENPHVVSMYAKYHDKGFEVFSVSLDNKAESWKAAIEKDNLSWPNHVSDLKGWGSAAAKTYGVSSIPCTFLLDREGRILARGLRGESLTQALKQIFGE